jgi:hypothetical protein
MAINTAITMSRESISLLVQLVCREIDVAEKGGRGGRAGAGVCAQAVARRTSAVAAPALRRRRPLFAEVAGANVLSAALKRASRRRQTPRFVCRCATIPMHTQRRGPRRARPFFGRPRAAAAAPVRRRWRRWRRRRRQRRAATLRPVYFLVDFSRAHRASQCIQDRPERTGPVERSFDRVYMSGLHRRVRRHENDKFSEKTRPGGTFGQILRDGIRRGAGEDIFEKRPPRVHPLPYYGLFLGAGLSLRH